MVKDRIVGRKMTHFLFAFASNFLGEPINGIH